MSYSPFIASFEQLPQTLPIFPLPGAIVMPGNELPLNIFEPRYLNMVNDALATHRMIGMIQPKPDAADEDELCQTGCAGRITQFRETLDGRIEMVLTGACRFDIDQILPTTRGYRMIVPNWLRFETDYEKHDDELSSQHDHLVSTARRYIESKGLHTDWDAMERMSTVGLMNSLSMALPISVEDKQVLLESIDVEKRLLTFVAMLDSETGADDSATKH